MADWLTESLTGREARLSFFDAVTLVREREPMRVARAEAVVRTALDTGEIRRDRLRGWYCKEDFLDWLDRHYPATPVSRVEPSGNSASAAEIPPQPEPRRRRPKAKVLQEAAEKRLLSVFPESGGVPPASLGPTAITERVNEGLSPIRHYLRDTVTRAVQSLKIKAEEKAKQNQ